MKGRGAPEATAEPVIALLGHLHVRTNGIDAAAPRGLGGRLLTMLALEPESGCDDEMLIGRLWQGVPPTNASFSLRNQVAALRRLVGADAIVRTNAGYLLDRAHCPTDVDRFDELLEEARSAHAGGHSRRALQQLESALALVRGPVLADVRHESWAVRHVHAIEERILLAEELWASARLRDGSVARELPRLRAAAEAQPQREVRWQQLIEAATASGRRAEALRAGQDARRALATFGLDAGPGILAAERAALESRTALDVEPRGLPRLLATRTGPFVGRERELAVLASGHEVTVVLGDPGTGKTRLLAEHAVRAHRTDGTSIVYVRADRTAEAPHFVSALARELVAVAGRPEVTGPLAVLLAPDPEASARLDPALKSGAIRRALARLMNDLAIGGPLVVLADDVHRLGPDDWGVLAHLLEAAPAQAQFVLAARHPDTDVTGLSWTDQIRFAEASTIVLGPLARHDIDAMVAAHASVADHGQVAAAVWAVSAGNPLVALEALDDFARTGRCEPGSPRLAPVLAGALADLGSPARRLLLAMAVIARPVDVGIAARAAGLEADLAAAAVDELRHRRIVDDGGDGRVHVRADGYLSIARASVGPADHTRICRRLADDPVVREDEPALLFGALLDIAPFDAADARLLDDTFPRVARHLVAAGALIAAVDASRRYLAAAGTGDAGAPSVAAHLVAATLLLSSATTVGDGRALLDVVVERARALDDAELLTDALLALGPVETGGGHGRRTAEDIEQLVTRLRPDDVPRRVQALCWAAHHRLNGGERGLASDLLRQAAVLADPSPDPMWRGLVLAVAAQAEQTALGSPAAATRAHTELERWTKLTGALSADGAARLLGAAIAFGTGTLVDVAVASDRIAEIATVMPRSDLCWLPNAIDAAVLLAQGRRDDARAAIMHAATVGNELGVSAAEAAAATQQVLLLLLDGSLGPLAALLESTMDLGRGRTDVTAVYGLACVHVGETATARQVAAALGRRERLLAPAGLGWPVAAMAAAELAYAVRDRELAGTVWHELRSWSGWGLNTHGIAYLGAADIWLGAAAAALGRDQVATHLLRAGAAQEDHRGAVVWRDRALALAAEVEAGR